MEATRLMLVFMSDININYVILASRSGFAWIKPLWLFRCLPLKSGDHVVCILFVKKKLKVDPVDFVFIQYKRKEKKLTSLQY